jgi:hypothetical protein
MAATNDPTATRKNEAALLRSSFAWKALLAMYENSAAKNSSGSGGGVLGGMGRLYTPKTVAQIATSRWANWQFALLIYYLSTKL